MQEALCLGCGPVARVGTRVVICHIVGSWPLAPLIRGCIGGSYVFPACSASPIARRVDGGSSPGTLMAPWWVPQQLWAR